MITFQRNKMQNTKFLAVYVILKQLIMRTIKDYFTPSVLMAGPSFQLTGFDYSSAALSPLLSWASLMHKPLFFMEGFISPEN